MDSNNNNTNDTEEQPQPSTSFLLVDDQKELDNETFEIIDSQIPKDHHVHVGSKDNVDSKISCNDLGTNEANDSAVPDSSTEVKVQEQRDSENELPSRRVLKELNQEDSTGQYKLHVILLCTSRPVHVHVYNKLIMVQCSHKVRVCSAIERLNPSSNKRSVEPLCYGFIRK